MRALLKMKEGSVYSPKQIREDSKKIADAYGSGGYVDLQVTPQGVPAGQGTIDVQISRSRRAIPLSSRGSTSSETRAPKTK